MVGVDGDIHFAFGDAAKGTTGFRLTHRQALAAQAVALAAGSPPRAVAFSEVAPVAMMLGSSDLLRAWVLSTLAGLAADDEHHARLRETLLAFLQSGGSYKTTAERLMLHKNTVQYRIRKAEESLGRPVGENRHDVELALQASHWLGSSVLRSVLVLSESDPAGQEEVLTAPNACERPRATAAPARAAPPRSGHGHRAWRRCCGCAC